jgi:hypothetical protein
MAKQLYNVTVLVEHNRVDEWLTYMTEGHIQEVMNTDCFVSFKLNRLKFVDEKEGLSFAVQYIAESAQKLQEYMGQHAPALQADHQKRFGESALAFRTIMEILHESNY